MKNSKKKDRDLISSDKILTFFNRIKISLKLSIGYFDILKTFVLGTIYLWLYFIEIYNNVFNFVAQLYVKVQRKT